MASKRQDRFLANDKQDIIRLYTETMDDAAEFHLCAISTARRCSALAAHLAEPDVDGAVAARSLHLPIDFDYTHLAPARTRSCLHA